MLNLHRSAVLLVLATLLLMIVGCAGQDKTFDIQGVVVDEQGQQLSDVSVVAFTSKTDFIKLVSDHYDYKSQGMIRTAGGPDGQFRITTPSVTELHLVLTREGYFPKKISIRKWGQEEAVCKLAQDGQKELYADVTPSKVTVKNLQVKLIRQHHPTDLVFHEAVLQLNQDGSGKIVILERGDNGQLRCRSLEAEDVAMALQQHPFSIGLQHVQHKLTNITCQHCGQQIPEVIGVDQFDLMTTGSNNGFTPMTLSSISASETALSILLQKRWATTTRTAPDSYQTRLTATNDTLWRTNNETRQLGLYIRIGGVYGKAALKSFGTIHFPTSSGCRTQSRVTLQMLIQPDGSANLEDRQGRSFSDPK